MAWPIVDPERWFIAADGRWVRIYLDCYGRSKTKLLVIRSCRTGFTTDLWHTGALAAWISHHNARAA